MKYTEEQAKEVLNDLIKPFISRVDYHASSCESTETYEFTNYDFVDRLDSMFRKLPETGLVVGDGGDAYIMRTGRSSGYGFRYVGIDNDWVYEISDDWSFESNPDEWDRTATKADEKRWKELLEKEVRNRYVKGQNIDAFNKDMMFGYEGFASINFQNMGFFIGELNEFSCDVDEGWNAVVFQDGKWAEIIEDEKVKEDIVVKLKQHTGQEYITINDVKYYPEKPKDLHEIARSVEGEELDKLINILHEKKVTSKFDSEGFKIVKK